MIEGAKKEGQVVFYTPLNINDSRPLLQRFEQKYPFIKTDLLRMSAEPLLNRILTEDYTATRANSARFIFASPQSSDSEISLAKAQRR